ncbi:alpha-L-fucosidase [Pedobacter cryoconitis]|uniref:alpha-L-fucosidase n=1 Tax=Pedobacter cryoconitis TaxID=188932 RepID=A0A7W8ZIS4_9SPHI|nr:alpha-L-fucosidase [Pedobacter cryoconitis]MBB5634816.1 alpha-L-fucosidase [Pedobacter cryoconitis]
MRLLTRQKLSILSAILFSTAAYAQTDAPKPYGAIPTERQLKWHETEMYCLIHFTPTTFQNKEWGYGDAAPSLFNPTKFNALQIVSAARSGGFKGVIFVTKHHDGFALWPTQTAAYNISESPWKNGKGNLVREFQQAAKQEGMKFGIYCSPWDRNNPEYGTPAYLTIYQNQLKELYSNYGELFMSWHDGANGGDGYYGGKNEKRKVDQSCYYDWMNTWAITRKLQPNASIFSDIGPDVRWVGNEKGISPETSWSTITIKGNDGKPAMPGFMDDANLGSGTRGGKQWIPFEGDVSLRPGWFYHADQDGQVKTVAELFSIYCKSVGHGGALDLGLSPTTEGLLHPKDVSTLAAFGKLLKQVFNYNLAKEAEISVSNVRNNQKQSFGTANLTDASRYSYWATDDDVHQANVQLDFKKPANFSIIQLRENIKLGQRIDSAGIDIFKNNQWQELAKATSIGSNRIIRLSQTQTAQKIRIRIYAPVAIALSEIGLYLEPEIKSAGTKGTANTYPKTNWKATSPAATGLALKNAADNNESTVFETRTSNYIDLDFSRPLVFSAVGYLPAQDGITAGAIEKYELLSSEDGKNWKTIASGEFSNIKANPILQRISLAKKITTRYLRLLAKQTVPAAGEKGSENNLLRIAEIEVYSK